jgi:adenylate kinase
MYVVFFGPPGCGKGTQAKLLQKSKGYLQLSSGDMLRAEIELKTKLGLEIESIISSGAFVSDDLMIQVFFSVLEKNAEAQGIIFDGFPRTLNQAQKLVDELKKKGKELHKVVSFQVDVEQLINRVEHRYLCKKCQAVYSEVTRPMSLELPCNFCGHTDYYKRPDDNRDAMKKRLDIYSKETEPLITFFKKLNLLVEVNGMKPVEEVSKAIEEALRSTDQRSSTLKVS